MNELTITPFITYVNRYGIMYICISDFYVMLCDSFKGGQSPVSLKLVTKSGW